MLARSVWRRSMRWPCGCGVSRRVLTWSKPSTMRLMASLAGAISAAVICAKSFFSSTSRSDTVKRASSSISCLLALDLVAAREQRVEHALRGLRLLGLRPARRSSPATSSRSAVRDSRACERKSGTPGRTAPSARGASRTRRAASSRNPPCRRRRPRAPRPAHRAPSPARAECRPRAARGRSRGCSRRAGRVSRQFARIPLRRGLPSPPRLH